MAILTTISPFILVCHVIICVFMVISILLQAGKGADIGATFGVGGAQSLFGARGAATFLSKLTTTAALLFLVTSFSLAMIHKNRVTGAQPSVVEPNMPPSAPMVPQEASEPKP